MITFTCRRRRRTQCEHLRILFHLQAAAITRGVNGIKILGQSCRTFGDILDQYVLKSHTKCFSPLHIKSNWQKKIQFPHCLRGSQLLYCWRNQELTIATAATKASQKIWLQLGQILDHLHPPTCYCYECFFFHTPSSSQIHLS